MHSFNCVAAFGALFAAVAAVPVKRDVVTDIVTEIDIVTELATVTVWVDASDATETPVAAYVPQSHYTWTHDSWTQALPTTSAAPIATAYTTSSSSSAYVAPSSSSTSTSTYVAPVQTTATEPVASQSATTSVYVAPTASSTSQYVAPSSVYTPPVATSTSTSAAAAAAATTTTGSSVSSGSSTYSGDITYYDVGLGSCGISNTDSEMVVAMSAALMNKATMCGKTITLSYDGTTQQATVVDTCPGCASGSLDLSPTLFEAFAPLSSGRIQGVEWWFD